MCFQFAQWVEQRLVEDEHFYRKIIFSDEAHFHLGGYVNKQNCIWGSENPHVVVEKPMHPQRVTVWCDFDPVASLGHFSSKMSKELPSLSIALPRHAKRILASKI